MFILQRNLKKYNVFLLLAINILLLSSCGKPSEISSFKNTFSISSNVDIELTEIYNSYSGSPYEGESLYTVDIKSDTSTFFEEWNDVSTYNFSVCIFDSEAGIVYYYKIDT